jgi:hypothetical protein
LAARKAAAITSGESDELQQEVALALNGFEAAERAAREEAERRGGLHVANERLAAGMSDEVQLEGPSRRRGSRIAELMARLARRTRRTEPRPLAV